MRERKQSSKQKRNIKNTGLHNYSSLIKHEAEKAKPLRNEAHRLDTSFNSIDWEIMCLCVCV